MYTDLYCLRKQRNSPRLGLQCGINIKNFGDSSRESHRIKYFESSHRTSRDVYSLHSMLISMVCATPPPFDSIAAMTTASHLIRRIHVPMSCSYNELIPTGWVSSIGARAARTVASTSSSRSRSESSTRRTSQLTANSMRIQRWHTHHRRSLQQSLVTRVQRWPRSDR